MQLALHSSNEQVLHKSYSSPDADQLHTVSEDQPEHTLIQSTHTITQPQITSVIGQLYNYPCVNSWIEFTL